MFDENFDNLSKRAPNWETIWESVMSWKTWIGTIIS